MYALTLASHQCIVIYFATSSHALCRSFADFPLSSLRGVPRTSTGRLTTLVYRTCTKQGLLLVCTYIYSLTTAHITV